MSPIYYDILKYVLSDWPLRRTDYLQRRGALVSPFPPPCSPYPCRVALLQGPLPACCFHAQPASGAPGVCGSGALVGSGACLMRLPGLPGWWRESVLAGRLHPLLHPLLPLPRLHPDASWGPTAARASVCSFVLLLLGLLFHWLPGSSVCSQHVVWVLLCYQSTVSHNPSWDPSHSV